MFTNTKCSIYAGQDKVYTESVCLSTDVKPTTGIANGSTCIEMNTGKKFMYNEDGGEWVEVPSSGGGGGGDSDFSTAQVTIVNNQSSLELTIVQILPEPYNLILADYVRPTSDTITVPLYKGSIVLTSNGAGNVSVSGACEYADDQFIITGDCTITLA